MQSEHKKKGGHSNGVVSDIEEEPTASGISNGYSKLDKGIQNGDLDDSRLEHKRKGGRKMTTMEKDIISLIGQHLREKGLGKTLDVLMEESGCTLEHPMAGHFRTHVLLGQWKEALEALDQLSPLLGDPYCIEKMRLLLLEEKFLEHLEKGEKLMALQCLRHDLVALPIHHPGKRIQDLSQYLMCESNKDLYRLSNWPGVNEGGRQRLLDQLQAYLPPTLMLPPKRLELLLRQSVQLQVDKCPFHYTDTDISCYSLLTDHICQRSNFPSETVHTLKAHHDEVWFVQFSHNGSYLASGSKDGNIIIWKVEPSETPVRFLTMKGQSSGVTSLIWSPDDSLLMSCGTEDCPEVIVFDSKTGEEKCRVSNSPDDSLTCGCWHFSSKKFYVGGLRGQFYECSAEDGSVTSSWEGIRLHSIASHPFNNVVFAADSHLRIRQYNFEEKTSNTLVKEEHPIMTFTLSKDARYALLNVASQGVHMWDLLDRCMIRRYQGVTQGYYTIHSCYGINDGFIASGSEDNHVYVWNRKRETPIIVLQGHSRTVNSVCWNPIHCSMIASASDDCTIRVWGTDEEMKEQREKDKLRIKHKKQKKKDNNKATENGEALENERGEEAEAEEQQDNDDDDDEDDEEREDDIEMQEHQQQRRRNYEQLSEADLQALEMLDPDSSSQEENSSDRIEAAVSLSALSVSLQNSEVTLNTQNTRRVLASRSGRGIGTGMLVIMSTQGFHNREDESEEGSEELQSVSLPALLSQPSLEQDSRSVDLNSSVESSGGDSRQLESFHSVLSESISSNDPRTTSLPRRQQDEGEEQLRVEGRDTLTEDGGEQPLSSSNSSSSSNRTRSRLRDDGGGGGGGGSSRSIATESSVSTVV